MEREKRKGENTHTHLRRICIYGFNYVRPPKPHMRDVYTQTHAFYLFYLSVKFLFRPVPVLGVTLLIGIDPCILQLETSFSAHFLMAAVQLFWSVTSGMLAAISQTSSVPLSGSRTVYQKSFFTHMLCFLRLMKHLQSLEHLDGSVLRCRDLCPSPTCSHVYREASKRMACCSICKVCVRA